MASPSNSMRSGTARLAQCPITDTPFRSVPGYIGNGTFAVSAGDKSGGLIVLGVAAQVAPIEDATLSKVAGRSGRAWSASASHRLFALALSGSGSRETSDNYRLAAMIVQRAQLGAADPVASSYADLDAMFRRNVTGPYAPRVRVVRDLQSFKNCFGPPPESSPKCPSEIDGRTGAQWRDSVLLYLEWRLLQFTSRGARVCSPYHDALRLVLNPPLERPACFPQSAVLKFTSQKDSLKNRTSRLGRVISRSLA